MGLQHKLKTPPVYWWRTVDCEFSPQELLLIQRFIRLKTFDALAELDRCSPRTIRRQMMPIFAKIGTTDRQTALTIFQSVDIPEGVRC